MTRVFILAGVLVLIVQLVGLKLRLEAILIVLALPHSGITQ